LKTTGKINRVAADAAEGEKCVDERGNEGTKEEDGRVNIAKSKDSNCKVFDGGVEYIDEEGNPVEYN